MFRNFEVRADFTEFDKFAIDLIFQEPCLVIQKLITDVSTLEGRVSEVNYSLYVPKYIYIIHVKYVIFFCKYLV